MILAQMPTPQLPPLPEGPSLDRVRGPVELTTSASWPITLAVLFGLILCGLLIWSILRKRQKSPAALPPYQAALAELDAAAKLTEGDDERFAILTSAALRHYLENGLGLRFHARTSEEFLRSLKGNTRLDEAFQNKLGQALHDFDQVKFARATLRPDDRIRITDTVRRLIELAHASQQKEDSQA
ncbi:MAG: hypothetical protein EA353_01360 [Puniceicoccaceae bacterium]|nr:MAG: hypothetical protein EA353_01360 [Puniceicoccaceae bacterium]